MRDAERLGTRRLECRIGGQRGMERRARGKRASPHPSLSPFLIPFLLSSLLLPFPQRSLFSTAFVSHSSGVRSVLVA